MPSPNGKGNEQVKTYQELYAILSAARAVEERLQQNGFLVEFQRFVVDECRKNGVLFFGGSDAHAPQGVGGAREYYRAIFA